MKLRIFEELRETGNLAAVMNTMGDTDIRTAIRYQHPELDIVREGEH